MPPYHAIIGDIKLKELRKIMVSSPLMRAFAGLKPLLATHPYLPLRVLQG